MTRRNNGYKGDYRKLLFVWTENVLKIELFANDVITILFYFPNRVFLKQKSKTTGDCYVFKFLQRSVEEKHLMCFLRYQIPPAL